MFYEDKKLRKKEDFRETENEMRLNKFLSDAGVCSRREADRLIESGAVLINGVPALLGQKIKKTDVVTYKGKVIKTEEEFILIALNKPLGIECTADPKNKDNVVKYVGLDKRIYPIGRLDKNSEGLLLLTNNGDIVNKILKASTYHEKEYVVKTDKEIDDDFIYKMSHGVNILETVTRECKVTKTGKYTFNIVLTQGLNRQIRRMCEALGYKVKSLKRIRIMNIKLDGIKYGTYRYVTDEELNELKKQLL